jgi:hypothetical protein
MRQIVMEALGFDVADQAGFDAAYNIKSIEADYSKRAQVCRALALYSYNTKSEACNKTESDIPRTIIQYWDQEEIPTQVLDLMQGWQRGHPDFAYRRFDRNSAADYIGENYGQNARTLFKAVPHPVTRSDIFRFLYIARAGGIYIDADEGVRAGLGSLSGNASLRLAARAWSHPQRKEVSVTDALLGVNNGELAIYLNNSPIIACAEHHLMQNIAEQIISKLSQFLSDGTSILTKIVMPPDIFNAFILSNLFEGGNFFSNASRVHVMHDWYDVVSREYWLDYKRDVDWRKEK